MNIQPIVEGHGEVGAVPGISRGVSSSFRARMMN